MSARQSAFRPGEPVMLRLTEAPWFSTATFLGYEPDPFDPDRLMYAVRDERTGQTSLVPAFFVHRDGPEFQAWLGVALALQAIETTLRAEGRAFGIDEAEVAGDRSTLLTRKMIRQALPSYPSYTAARDALSPVAARLFALHPQPF